MVISLIYLIDALGIPAPVTWMGVQVTFLGRISVVDHPEWIGTSQTFGDPVCHLVSTIHALQVGSPNFSKKISQMVSCMCVSIREAQVLIETMYLSQTTIESTFSNEWASQWYQWRVRGELSHKWIHQSIDDRGSSIGKILIFTRDVLFL